MDREITGHTKLACLLGSPVSHSISPMMHNEAFRVLGIDCRYLAFEVDEGKLEQAVAGLKAVGAVGFNLTMPNKNKMAALCDRLSPAARICRAVNTVVIEADGTLSGYTTDGTGFLRSCLEEGAAYVGKKITLLGAGGAGTAILAQSALDGAREISVFSRKNSSFAARTEQVITALREQTDCKIQHYDYDADRLKKEISGSQLLVNTTSIGMAPAEQDSLIPDPSYLHDELAVGDVIYNPRVTRLVKMAREQGLTAFGGLSMLLYQGAEAFRLWTGQDMPVERVREKCFRE